SWIDERAEHDSLQPHIQLVWRRNARPVHSGRAVQELYRLGFAIESAADRADVAVSNQLRRDRSVGIAGVSGVVDVQQRGHEAVRSPGQSRWRRAETS